MCIRDRISSYRGVVDTQELVGRSHHVDLVRLSFGTLFVHELVHGFVQRGALQINAHHKEQSSAQSGGTPFGDAAAVYVHLRCV